MVKLYELAEHYDMVLALAEDVDGDDEALDQELDALAEALEDKCNGIARVVRTLDREIDMLDAERKAIADKMARLTANRERIVRYVERCMLDKGVLKVSSDGFRWAIQTNPPRVEVRNADALPPEFRREKTEVVVDKRAILEHHKRTGETPPGCEIVRDCSLRMR